MAELKYATGWFRDLPDFRDYTVETEEPKAKAKGIRTIKASARKMGVASPAAPAKLPVCVDFRVRCSPIEDQGQLGSCTANATVGLLEYFERQACGNYIDHSRLFVYKVTRELLGWSGDSGGTLRAAMGALALFGAPPEKYWPYDIANFDMEPSAFVYAFAENYQAVRYFRYDPPGTQRPELLARLKTWLAAGWPSMFGFTCYSSLSSPQTAATGKIPFPASGEQVVGGHAIVAIGYDDNMVIQNPNANGPQTTGAFIIRNSWGTGWGEAGYGYLPYEYLLRGTATDWWTLLKDDWVDSNQFGI
ncbi:MAG: C1 family peptidase [Bacteroidota bacterium]